MNIPEDLCDCGDEPRRGIKARKHMTHCRYGIIEEWEDYGHAQPAPLDERPHPGENHEFRTKCRRCGEFGMLHVALITDNEVVTITNREDSDD